LTQKQAGEFAFNRVVGSSSESLSFPDFVELAKSHGMFAQRISSQKGLKSKLRNFLMEHDSALCEVMMDPNQIQAPKAVNKRLPDGTMKATALEDAWPYLTEEEIAENLQT
jgi:thiamine pyrophosphate-dependent acetolactate synthase large subunit-like protein